MTDKPVVLVDMVLPRLHNNPDAGYSHACGVQPTALSTARTLDVFNRPLGTGYRCYEYMGCTSGMAAASVIHDGEELVGLYFGSWQLNAVSLEESRPDTPWVRPEDFGKVGFALNNCLGLQDKIQMGDTAFALHNLRSLP